MPAQGGDLSRPQQHPPDVVVVGGGVIGLAVAWEAGRRGLRATVLERGDPGSGATGVAAGMLAPVSEAAFGEPEILALNLTSAALYPAWVEELREASGGMDPGYLPCGSLLVARDGDQAAALERELVFRQDQGLGIRRLAPTEARRREPALTAGLRLALEAPEDHAVDPARLVAALCAAAENAGGGLRRGVEAAGLALDGDRVTGVHLADGERLDAEHVVIAAGCWSNRLDGLPPEARLPLRPVKGQLLRLRDPSGPGLVSCALRGEEVYLVPRGDGRYVLGASVEELGFDTTRTAGVVFELLREAIELVPGVGELEVEAVLAGLRPGTPDNAPVIGPGALEGLAWATGHYRHGILLAPVTSRALVARLLGEDPPQVTAPFSAARFSAGVAA
jgi:glycine oxidase